MMRKKIIPVFFILLANIIVLGHAFIPHHHHQREVCIVRSHCEDDNESHEHNTTNSGHHHDGDNNTEICVLKQFFIVPTNHVRPDYRCLTSDENNDHTFSFQAIQHQLNIRSSILAARSFYHPQLAHSVYLIEILNGIGLRAPPVV
jgi:hypothetical protein